MPITEQERVLALDALRESAARLEAAVAKFTPDDWIEKPPDAGWCAAEIVEHLAMVEAGLMVRIRDGMEPAPAGYEADRALDKRILQVTPVRSRRVEAPERARPCGRWQTGVEALRAFSQSRRFTLEWLEHTDFDLRAVAAPHSVLGPLDGYQWLLLLAAHTDRHIAQIRDIRSAASDQAGA